ncbi:hypothetical protein [Clostridium aminobutyricum]|uniref:Phage tail tape measure protein n=1 Tax=Clostridium aminobutyricum TaxID=33953 RepID=A0A939D8S7_CLOAM|nr:hypothetical protein [Clostridium aminobutyricum]MBN7773167.1 hypothetical protein [Clostridium aminobutyricum]
MSETGYTLPTLDDSNLKEFIKNLDVTISKIKALGKSADFAFNLLKISAKLAIAPIENLAGKILNKLENKLKSTGQNIQKFGKYFKNTFKEKPIDISGAASKIAGFVKESIGAAQAQVANELKFKSALNLKAKASDQASNSILKMISAQRAEGVVSDAVQMAGVEQLATYAKNTNSIKTLLPAMNNLIAKQKGLGSTTEDATKIADLMGTGLNGQTDKLQEAGIAFTQAEENAIKYGTAEEKASVLAKVISKNVGNANKQMAKTDAGAIKQAKDQFLDLKESIGKILLPYLAKFAKWFTKNQPVIKSVIQSIVKTFIKIGEPIFSFLSGFFDIIKKNKKVATIIGIFAAVFVTLTTVLGIFNAVLAMSPLFIIVGVIALVVAAIAGLILYWDNLIEAVKKAWGKITEFFKHPIKGIIDLVQKSKSDGTPGKASIGNKALGTSYWKGGLTYINERGGEIVDLPNGSKIIPADKSDRLLSGNGVSFGNVYITAKGVTASQVVNEIVPQLKLQLANM